MIETSQDTTTKRSPSAVRRRVDILWGVFLTSISVIFSIVFVVNVIGVIELHHRYVETTGQILAKKPVELVSQTGITQQFYACRVAYDAYLADNAMCFPAVASNKMIRVVYDKNKPLTVYCGGKKPSIFRTIRMYSKSYFWILVGWIAPSFLVIGLSVLYEEIYIKKEEESDTATSDHSE